MPKGNFRLEALLGLLIILLPIVAVYSQGNADVSRKRNLQYSEFQRTMNADVSRLRNYLGQELQRTMNTDLTKLRNYQIVELARTMNSDVMKTRNHQQLELKRTMNSDVLKPRNLQFFELGPRAQLYVNIDGMQSTDQSGSPKTSFLRGEVVQFNYSIQNSGSVDLFDGVVSTIVLDPANATLFLTYTNEDLVSGITKEFIVGYRLPTSCPTGTYTARVMVFSDWPHNGGIGVASREISFNVS